MRSCAEERHVFFVVFCFALVFFACDFRLPFALNRFQPFASGMNKMVINHLEKLFVTNDAATILQELDVFHPAAKLAVMASQRQESEARLIFV